MIDPARVVFIKREMIDPPEREEEQLPEAEVQVEPERLRNFGRVPPTINVGVL